MRIQDIVEGNVRSWTVDPDFDLNDQEMKNSFTGYDREQEHFSRTEKKLLRDEGHVTKVRNILKKSPVDFSFYFWQSPNPNYDLTAFHGQADPEWLRDRMGERAANDILSTVSPDAITFVLTNNMSDEQKISLRSPWMLIHRVAHGLFGDDPIEGPATRIATIFDDFLKRVLTRGYQCEWPDVNSPYGEIFSRDYYEIYGKLMGETIGTMRAAREKRFVSQHEWRYETFCQYVITGKIKLNPLPEHFDEGLELTRDPKARAFVMREWSRLPKRLEKTFFDLLTSSCGKIFVN